MKRTDYGQYLHTSHVRYWRCPDALLLFSCLGLWSAFLAWRWRRIKHLANTTPLA
ncbi:hypothetical protein OKA05_28995 [Luteolibacter arcticus]|uniref:Uncharacterized protein n=1 Tax=Luteolibacter arcticus TaxID=1581411 RepID=A0ABT3GT13_9BACT|nr:hypothetical protein [Luteolibacter arcticus]MCW1926625.1 hypothetical protein [Luteolibacter arcticus]